MKLALFIPNLLCGGAQRVFITLSKAFAAMGYDVDLVASSLDGPLQAEIPNNVRIIDLGGYKPILSFLPMAKYMREHEPDLIISTLTTTNVSACIARLLVGHRAKLVIREANAILPNGEMSSISERVEVILARLFYPVADHFLAVSESVAKEMIFILGLPRDKIQIIDNPSVRQCIGQKALEKIDHRWFNDEKTPILISAGRLMYQKDFSTLIRAFSLVRKERAARLIVLGDGEEKNALMSLTSRLGVSEDVAFIENTSNPFRYFSKASVFILSSRWEGLPNVLIEAMACGAPVVATDCSSAVTDILDNGRYGKIVGIGNPEEMASAIMNTIDAPPSKDLLKNAVERFRVHVVAQQYAATFQSILSAQ